MSDLAGLLYSERLSGVFIVLAGFVVAWLFRTKNSRVNTLGFGFSFSFLGAVGLIDSFLQLPGLLLVFLFAAGWLAMGLFSFRATRSILVLLAFIAVPAGIGILIIASLR